MWSIKTGLMMGMVILSTFGPVCSRAFAPYWDRTVYNNIACRSDPKEQSFWLNTIKVNAVHLEHGLYTIWVWQTEIVSSSSYQSGYSGYMSLSLIGWPVGSEITSIVVAVLSSAQILKIMVDRQTKQVHIA